MSKPTKQAAQATQFQKGTSGNPGGLTANERAARDLLRQTLSTPEMHAAWKVGYLNQLVAENPIILKDFADRVGGKPRDVGEEEATSSTAALVALLATLVQSKDKGRIEEDLERAAR